MLDKTDSGSKMELLFERSLERLRRISYHGRQSPTDVSRISFLGEAEMSCVGVCESGAVTREWVESRRSSGGAWPLDIRLVTSLATEK